MDSLRRIVFIASLFFLTPYAIAGTVDINTADAQTMAEGIDGVGPGKAQAIVGHRDQHGPFKSVNDLTQVKGIGPSILEKNRSRLTIGKKPKP